MGIVFQGVATDLERYMTLLSDRQKLVASNIANVDTPGYRTEDIDFHAEFERQTEDGEAPPQVVQPDGLPTKPDGNNVSLDREARLLAENALRFSVASSLARAQLQELRTALGSGNAA